jgi:hypothetical protein
LDLEAECFAHDMLGLERYKTINPRPETTARGEPFWDGHPAQALLKLFVAKQDREWKNKTIQRKLLPPEARLKNTAFQAFTLPTFRNHYYREIRVLIEEVYSQKNAIEKGSNAEKEKILIRRIIMRMDV